MHYKVARIPKGRGAFREIYIPEPDSKFRLRLLLPFLEEIVTRHDKHGVNYAFEKGKNCALNALQHAGYKYTLSFDLENFFDSVSKQHVSHLIPDWLLNQCLIDGVPKQGLPTSPLVATIAFLRYDALIINHLQKLRVNAVYTRYADDLAFSFDNFKDAAKITTIVRQVVEQGKFKLNERKTTLQTASNGRIIITGIAVDEQGLHPTRRTLKKIRAALHQNNCASAAGLIEWSKCKLPSPEGHEEWHSIAPQ